MTHYVNIENADLIKKRDDFSHSHEVSIPLAHNK